MSLAAAAFHVASQQNPKPKMKDLNKSLNTTIIIFP